MPRPSQIALALLLVTACAVPRASRAEEPAAAPAPTTTPEPTGRRPGSYLGGQVGYSQFRSWLPANEEHGALDFGPLHGYGAAVRVGDAFFEWLTLGLEVGFASSLGDVEAVGQFGLMLDLGLYPVAGLGLRPAAGVGFGFAAGEEEWEFGGGGPLCLSFSLVYELEIIERLALTPVAKIIWITSDEFDGLTLFFGLEVGRYFLTATS